MKKKYAALVLGLAISMTGTSVYAAVLATDGTVYVEGESSYTVTVDSYSDSADLSGASTVSQWSDYEVEKPAELA